MPKVSILMTAYNAEKYIRESICSVIDQTFVDFEFLIIDDASIDETFSIIQSFSDPRIIAIKKEQNSGFRGYVENLNLLLLKAKGEYIARIDADDIWHPEKLNTQINFLEANLHIGVVGCSKANKIDEDGNIIGVINLLPNAQRFEDYILKKNPIIHPSIVFRKNIHTLYREKLFYCEDYDFHLQNLSKNIQYHIIDEILMDYRVLQHSMSHNSKVLERALFVNQAKKFYNERMQYNGADSYNTFDPNSILNILTPSYPNAYSLLKTALRFAFIAGLEEDFSIIFNKIKTQYAIAQIPLLYRIIHMKFSFFYQIYQLK